MSNQRSLRILIVEDETPCRLMLSKLLVSEGHTVVMTLNAVEAMEQFSTRPFDVAIASMTLPPPTLPEMDGLELLASFKKVQPEALLIVLAAQGSFQTAIAALRLGVFDYLVKPVNPEEVLVSIQRAETKLVELARQKELIRLMEETLAALKGQAPVRNLGQYRAANTLSSSAITLDLDRRFATAYGRPLSLTPTEFDVLALLMRQPGQPLSSEEILTTVKEYTSVPKGARMAVRVYISRLRHKIEANPQKPRYLLTVRGIGYMFSE